MNQKKVKEIRRQYREAVTSYPPARLEPFLTNVRTKTFSNDLRGFPSLTYQTATVNIPLKSFWRDFKSLFPNNHSLKGNNRYGN